MDHDSSELLRAIVRLPGDAEKIHLLAGKVRDWDALLNLAQEHRVVPMLFSRLEQTGTAIPSAAHDRLRSAYERNVFHNMTNAAELIDVLKTFYREAILAMPFKGVVLGVSVYGNLATRTAGDIDLLIHYKDLARASALLLERGYKLTSDDVLADGSPAPNCYEFRFERPADGKVLELRWRLELTYAKFKRDLGMDWIWPRCRTTVLAGAEVPNISLEITLLLLSMHGSRHMWSRLLWICDIAQLLASSPDLDWSEVLKEAKTTGLWRTLALGVLLAHRFTGVPVPAPILQRFEADASASRLARHIDKNLLEAPGTAPPGRVPYWVHLLGFRDRARLLFSMDFLRPNERDRAALPLPKSLHALYYVIRPFRILRDRSAR